MAKLKAELWKTLKELNKDEFKSFKWFLREEILDGFPGIPVAQLDEETNRENTVDQMVQKYLDDGALKVTIKILEEIDRNDLVQRVQNFRLGWTSKLGEGTSMKIR